MNHKSVYISKHTSQKDFTGIAVSCQYWDKPHFKGLCYLVPPDRGHMIEGEIVEETPDGFKYRSDGYDPGIWEFKALTLDDFRNEHGKVVIGGDEIGQEVNTTEELYEWFNSRFGVADRSKEP